MKNLFRALEKMSQGLSKLSSLLDAVLDDRDRRPAGVQPEMTVMMEMHPETAVIHLPESLQSWQIPKCPDQPIEATEVPVELSGWNDAKIPEPMSPDDSEVWNDEEIPEPPVVDVKIVTTVDSDTGEIAQQVEVKTTQPAAVRVETQVKPRQSGYAVWSVREYDGRRRTCVSQKYLQAFADKAVTGVESQEMASIAEAADDSADTVMLDLMSQELPHTCQVTAYKLLCDLCDSRDITYGTTRPFDKQEYVWAVRSLVRLLRRNGVTIPMSIVREVRAASWAACI